MATTLPRIPDPDEDLVAALMPAYPQDELARAVLQWVAAHPEKVAPDPQNRLFHWAAQRNGAAFHAKVHAAVARFWLNPPPADLQTLWDEADGHFRARWGQRYEGITEKGLCAYIRHHRSNYDEVLGQISGGTDLANTAGDTYADLKVHLCCRIVRKYALTLSPCEAAFDTRTRSSWPERFRQIPVPHLEHYTAHLLGLETPDGAYV